MSINKALSFSIFLLIVTLIIFEFSNIDILIQDTFFNFETKEWIIDRYEPIKKFIFYDGAKWFIIAIALFNIIFLILSYKLKKFKIYQKKLWMSFLSLTFVPLIVASGKNFTNVYCPYQIERYGGDKPYIKIFEDYPSDFEANKCGKCFPAGHATGGFAFMVLFFIFDRYKKIGFFIGFSFGWIMGLYQMLKGAHYLSHTIVTMLLAWIIILIIHKVLDFYQFNDKK